MKKFECVGIPDEENFHSKSHTSREYWTCMANDRAEAERKAFDHFYYFHEVFVSEVNE